MTKDSDEQIGETEFWEKITSLLLSLVCLIEKDKLRRKPTTAELRAIGKRVYGLDSKIDKERQR